MPTEPDAKAAEPKAFGPKAHMKPEAKAEAKADGKPDPKPDPKPRPFDADACRDRRFPGRENDVTATLDGDTVTYRDAQGRELAAEPYSPTSHAGRADA